MPLAPPPPSLYAIHGAHQGRPVAYVVFRTTDRVHDTDALKVRVAGRTGRSYSVGSGSCVRAAFVKETAKGTPLPFLKAGRKYRVTITYHGKTLLSRTLVAHGIGGEKSDVPRC
jgi:hypothetical protein